jgi:hypothetical protein
MFQARFCRVKHDDAMMYGGPPARGGISNVGQAINKSTLLAIDTLAIRYITTTKREGDSAPEAFHFDQLIK